MHYLDLKQALFSLLMLLSGCFKADWSHIAKIDLNFVYAQLKMNHPGYVTDNSFKVLLNNLYSANLAEAKQIKSYEQYKKFLKNFGKAFNCAHLYVNFHDDIKSHQFAKKNSFHVEQINQNTVLIRLPTFMPRNAQEKKELESVIFVINEIKNFKNIIFDVRDNTGGSSEYGSRILKNIFDFEYYEQAIANLKANEYVQWRVSPDNIKHLTGVKNKFKNNSEWANWLANVIAGMEDAKRNNNDLYLEKTNNTVRSDFAKDKNKKITVLINAGCVSACLDFIDEIYALVDPILVGQKTHCDSIYMELREIELPSKNGKLSFPIKMYVNRKRSNNQPYLPDIAITKFDKNDANEIAKLHHDSWHNTFDKILPEVYIEKQSLQYLQNIWRELFQNLKEHVVFVAKKDNKILGFIEVGPIEDTGENFSNYDSEIYKLYVDTNLKQQGIGKLLLIYGLDYLRNKGYNNTIVKAFHKNSDAIKFYENMGGKFICQETLQDYHDKLLFNIYGYKK